MVIDTHAALLIACKIIGNPSQQADILECAIALKQSIIVVFE
jgi:hypothetical protein